MDFAIALDPQSPMPLYRQLYEELRRAILTRRLTPKQQLPSTRALSQSLGISRATVTLSYEQLLSEGYLETVVGAGTFVCAELPDELLQSAPVKVTGDKSHPAITLSAYGKSLASPILNRSTSTTAPIHFSYGCPALDQFPIEIWRKLISRHCRHQAELLNYATDSGGYLPLRQAIAHYLARIRAVQCDPHQVVIVNGSQQALDLVTRLLIDRGDRVVLENPGYLGARRVFLASGATLHPAPVDERGLIVKSLETVTDAKLIYVTPSHQFPTGAVLSLPRRLELLTWAHKTDTLILEDDYDSEYRYSGRLNSAQADHRPLPALQGLDQSQSVIYIGTFSKVLFPALRIGYLVVPSTLVDLVIQAKWLSDRQSPLLEQAVLTDFINEGHLERHIRRMRTLYDQRRQALVQALQSQFGDKLTILGESAGIHLMARLHTPLSTAEILQRAAQVGVGIISAQPCYLTDQREGEVIFGYAELTETQIHEGIKRLAQALSESGAVVR